MALTQSAIIETCIAMLNRDGAENLTMRALGKELGVKAPALYWHFEGKGALYAGIAELMCERYPFPESSGDIQADLAAFLRAYRAMLLTVRDSVEVFENSLPVTPRRVAIIRAFGEKIRALGVQPENLMTVSNLLNNYVLSFTADEVRAKNTPPEARAAFSEATSPEDRAVFFGGEDFDGQFELGLRVLLAGLRATDV